MMNREAAERDLREWWDSDFYECDDVPEWLMSWLDKYSRPRMTVTREQVLRVMNRHGLGECYSYPDKGDFGSFIIDDLLALMNGEPEWCEHMEELLDDKHKNLVVGTDGDACMKIIGTSITFCPICGAKRPGQEGE